MNEQESVEFIAERPKIFDNDLTMPWPDESLFKKLRDERLEGIESTPGDWQYENTLSNVKDEYFRMRYRGALWSYENFTGEPLSEDDTQKLDQFLAHGYWVPATDVAVKLYKDTNEDKYREAAIFACGLHIYDAINHSWGFLDSRFANDSGVREKHFLTFLHTIGEVSRLPMIEQEEAYFKPLQLQYNLAFAEMAAQNPVSAARDLVIFDPEASDTDRYRIDGIGDARSSLINFIDVPNEVKYRVVERFKKSAAQALSSEYSSPVFALECLQLFGLARVDTFYESYRDSEPAWWRLTAEEIMNGDTTRLEKPEPDDAYEQNSLF